MQSTEIDNNYADYLQNKIIPDFRKIIDKDIYSLIINQNHQIEICTDKSAQSVGLNSWEDLRGFSFANFSDKEAVAKIFKKAYFSILQNEIEPYARKLITLQRIVFESCRVIQFIDMLPYNDQFITYITTYTPLLHPDGTVIAIQSFSIQSYVLRFQGHISDPNSSNQADLKGKFTNRELEILFLLSNGATQDQIAQILNISRGTISAVVSNQLCPKFNIAGANTKLLTEAAINARMYKNIPESLWRPALIILNHDLSDMLIGSEL